MRLSVPFSLGNQLEAGHCSRCRFSANMRASLSRRSLVFACARWSENTKTKVFADEDHKLNLFSLYRQAYFRKLGDLLQTGYGSRCRFSANMRASFSRRSLVFACARWSENTKTKVFADEDHKLNLFSLYRQAYFRKLGDLLQTGYGSRCRFSANMRASFSRRSLVFACARWSTTQQ